VAINQNACESITQNHKMTKKLPTEFSINMNLDKIMILQQGELNMVKEINYFDEYSPCHIYFVGKRPRIAIDKNYFVVTDEYLEFKFLIQRQENFEELPVKIANSFNTLQLKLISNYPYNFFSVKDDKNNLIFEGKPIAFLQEIYREYGHQEFLDFEILYIGQSYGVKGARTAPDRLVSHSTLQGIYAEAINNNPDCEIWLSLASFSQVNIMMFDGRSKFSEDELEEDKKRFPEVFNKLQIGEINEQQKINFTEAALIRYFQPPYNKIYKDSFPNPAHTTYSECYDLDINSVCIELQTYELANCMFYSDTIPKAPWHMKDFLLHSKEDRKSMFDFYK
jgi:hypothetical protein